MTDYTSPELFTERAAAKRVKKRMDAERKRNGLCVLCIHREETAGITHCKGAEGRQFGYCQYDNRAPKFEFDASVMERFRDAA